MTVTTDEISSFVLEKGELTVSSIARDHGGTFVVEASNTEGVTRHEFKINVQCKDISFVGLNVCICLVLHHVSDFSV